MVPLSIYPPAGSPSCWGQKYQDGDIECGQCRFNDTCRKEVLRGSMNAPIPLSVSQVPFPSRPATPQWPAPANVQAPSPTPAFRPAPPPPPVAPQYQQPVPVSVAPLYHTGYQPQYQHPGYALPLEVPNPMQPWSRPGAAAPPYYFTQYPGETAVQRVTKNLILRAIAAITQELLGFFIQWTWPPSGSNKNQG
jgi:hypothetical protein